MRDGSKAVHAGEPGGPAGAINTPIVQSTTYRYPEAADGTAASHIYSRYDNPTVEAVEAKMAALEGSDGALAFASGMAAIQAICRSFVRPGDTIAVQEGVYGGTTAYIEDELAPMGVQVHLFSVDDVPAFPDATTLVWMESISNPLMRVPDISAWAKAAHEVGAKLAVDATFATPLLQRPLGLGADVVMHSASKYLGGHSDVTAGFVCHHDADREALWTRRRNLGATMDPQAAYLLGRGMKTLHLRMARHADNAEALVAVLEDRDVVVHHPWAAEHPDHGGRDRLAMAPGVVTLDVGSKEAAQRFRRQVTMIRPAASLGGVESLVSLPIETSHAYADDARRRAEGITDGLVRISLGIEDAEDLIEDVLRGLA